VSKAVDSIQNNHNHLSVVNSVEVTYELVIPYGRVNEGYNYTTAFSAYSDITSKLNDAISNSQFTSLIRIMSSTPAVYSLTYESASSDSIVFGPFTQAPTSAPSVPNANSQLGIGEKSNSITEDKTVAWTSAVIIVGVIGIILMYFVYRRLRGTVKQSVLADTYEGANKNEFSPAHGDLIADERFNEATSIPQFEGNKAYFAM
jgi:hypothetical protein